MRYFTFPENITVRAQEMRFGKSDGLDEDASVKRHLRGQKFYLDQYSESSGAVTLNNATAHWWIFKDDANIGKQASYWGAFGHTAALYQDELYEPTSGRASIAMLQEFGVSLGYQRVVIYIEPNLTALPDITTDTARTRLLINNEPLPWADWAAEFRDNMPPQIVELIENIGRSVKDTPHRDKIRNRLDEVRDLLDTSGLKPKKRGSSLGGPIEGKPDNNGPHIRERASPDGRGGKSSHHTRETIDNILSAFAENSTIAASKSKSLDIPKVHWLSVEDNTRKTNDGLEDRAARYVSSVNELHINGDFRVFTSMVENLCQIHQDKPGVQRIALETVREWYEQSLVEMVISAKSMSGSREWAPDSIKALLSEEGLTGAILGGRWLHWSRIKNSVSVKIGKAIRAKRPEGGPETNGSNPAKAAEPA